MATALRAPSSLFLESFLPVARATLTPVEQSSRKPIIFKLPLVHQFRVSSVLPAAFLPIPSILGSLWQGISGAEIWDGLLNAVPKKKTSHMKKRHRFMAGKALKDVTALNKCSACGRPKRAHVLCPHCVNSIRRWISTGFKTKKELEVEEDKLYDQYNEELRIAGQPLLKKPKRSDEVKP